MSIKRTLSIIIALTLTAGMLILTPEDIYAASQSDYTYETWTDGTGFYGGEIIDTENRTLVFSDNEDLLTLTQGFDYLWIDLYDTTTLIINGVMYVGQGKDAIFNIVQNEGATSHLVGRFSYHARDKKWQFIIYGTATMNKVVTPNEILCFNIFPHNSNYKNSEEKIKYGLHGNLYLNSIYNLPIGQFIQIEGDSCVYNATGELLAGQSSDAEIQWIAASDDGIVLQKLADTDILTCFVADNDNSQIMVNRFDGDIFIWEDYLNKNKDTSIFFKSDEIYKKYYDFSKKMVVKVTGPYWDGGRLDIKNQVKTLKVNALKKKAQSYKIILDTNVPDVAFSKVSGSSKIKISSTGKVTVAKGLKKGNYKIKVKVYAKDYEPINIIKTITIKVK